MKKKIISTLITLTISLNSYAQIKLDDIRQTDIPDNNQSQTTQNNSNSPQENQQSSNLNNLSSEQKQKAKINNLASIIIMNAAIVGYAKACKFNNENIQRIEDYFIKQYNVKDEPLVMAKYREKVAEFSGKSPTIDECRIFFKDFSLILKDVTN